MKNYLRFITKTFVAALIAALMISVSVMAAEDGIDASSEINSGIVILEEVGQSDSQDAPEDPGQETGEDKSDEDKSDEDNTDSENLDTDDVSDAAGENADDTDDNADDEGENEDDEPVVVEPVSVSVNISSATLKAEKTIKLTATIKGGDGTEKLVWSSSDESIATVDENGLVTTVSRGNAIITVSVEDGSSSASTKVAVTFKDVNQNKSYYKYVNWAVDNGIAESVDGGVNFAPEEAITRADMMLMLWRFAGSPEASGTSAFSDVAADADYASAIAWAVDKNIIKGFDDGTFRPDDTLTRNQAAILLWKYAGKPSPTTDGKTFSDVTKSSAISWASERGFIKGFDDGTFRPDDPCLRGQMTIILRRFSNFVDSAVMSNVKIILQKSQYVYTGKAIKADFKVTHSGFVLKEGVDYTVSYKNNTEVGTATVTVTGIGIYRGSRSANYKIIVGTPVLKSVSNEKSGVKITWRSVKQAVDYRVYRKAEGDKSWTGIGWAGNATQFIDKKAKNGVTYTYTVRAYDKNDGYGGYDADGLSIQRIGDPYFEKGSNGKWYLYDEKGDFYSSYNGFFTDEDGTFEVTNGVLTASVTGTELAMYKLAQNKSSDTDTLILINKSARRVAVYRWKYNSWQESRYVACSIGAPSTPTVEGTFKVSDQWYYFDSENVRCFYATRFYGSYWMHSVLYRQTSTPQTLVDGRLGYSISHGCIRLALDDAYYIYSTVPKGTTVFVY